MILERLSAPIVLAPLGGGPSTPQLAAAVSEAGGLGFLASGYLTAEQTREQITAARELTSKPLGVNVFVPTREAADPAGYADYVARLRDWARRRGAELGEPRFSDDDWVQRIELLSADPVEVVSFAFGCPPVEVVERLRSAGSEVWVTVTSPEEAEQAAAAGVDALVVQGAEAGGHRASFVDQPELLLYGLLPLLQLIGSRVRVRLVASGGIASGQGLAAALCAGASAAQLGSAFLLCPEAGTGGAHREALGSTRRTSLTRAFTGRLARGIRNTFMAEHDAAAPVAYPEMHYVTAPLRKAAREVGDAEAINLWAGEAYQLAEARPAAEVVRKLTLDARAASADLAARLETSGKGAASGRAEGERG